MIQFIFLISDDDVTKKTIKNKEVYLILKFLLITPKHIFTNNFCKTLQINNFIQIEGMSDQMYDFDENG